MSVYVYKKGKHYTLTLLVGFVNDEKEGGRGNTLMKKTIFLRLDIRIMCFTREHFSTKSSSVLKSVHK